MRFKQLDGFIGVKVALLKSSKLKVGKFKVCCVHVGARLCLVTNCESHQAEPSAYDQTICYCLL
ncbi:MAG: hypothetical protein JWP12_2607 [Bacteroidetes bacterium]|nr:hypothetical protein [Bacteroidota bacterium]